MGHGLQLFPKRADSPAGLCSEPSGSVAGDELLPAAATAFLLQSALKRGKVSGAIAVAFTECFSPAVDWISVSIRREEQVVVTENLMRPIIKRPLKLSSHAAHGSLTALALQQQHHGVVAASKQDAGRLPADLYAAELQGMAQFLALPVRAVTDLGEAIMGALMIGTAGFCFHAEYCMMVGSADEARLQSAHHLHRDAATLQELGQALQPMFLESVGRLLDHAALPQGSALRGKLVRAPSGALLSRASSSSAGAGRSPSSARAGSGVQPSGRSRLAQPSKTDSVDILAGLDMQVLADMPRSAAPALAVGVAGATVATSLPITPQDVGLGEQSASGRAGQF